MIKMLDMTFYPLAKPFSFVEANLLYEMGIASFYIKYNDFCYVYLLGHNSNGNMPKEVWLNHSRLQNQDISETEAYNIQFLDYYDTSKGVFLKRDNILGMMDFQDQALDVNNPMLGAATILTTIDGFVPQHFSCVINYMFSSKSKYDFRICINDLVLIKKFGGGCEGMSGSVIIQNNRIVGVLAAGLNDASNYGFCISIEQIMKKLFILDIKSSVKDNLKRVLKYSLK